MKTSTHLRRWIPATVATLLMTSTVAGPAGFTGDACFTGGCLRPFAKNGCGGADHKSVIS